jgi:cytoskeletal protein CcmA (bactofilin family)
MSRGFGAAKQNPRSAAAAVDTHVLGRGMRVRGRVSGEGNVRIEGEVEGDVKVSGQLELAATGTLIGSVSASQVTLDGSLQGDVEASGPIHIRAGARVVGDMNGAEVSLEEGASFRGRIDATFELPDGLEAGASKPATVAGSRRR